MRSRNGQMKYEKEMEEAIDGILADVELIIHVSEANYFRQL